jgi:hypothetical protein
MVERSSIINPFFLDLHDKIAPEIDRRMILLANGSAKRIDGSPDTVAEAYADQCAYIRALSDVLEICAGLEHNRHGNRPEEQQPQE